MTLEITFTLNGRETTWNGSPAACLLDVLREDCGNTGVKCGCREGECGACAVILDGRLVNACMVAMGRAAGSDVVTIEGYKKTERFAALDRAFAAFGAVQCGFCIPGMVMAAECLLRQHPNPTEEQIRVGISGNLCRCTGYNGIVKAIAMAAQEGKGLWASPASPPPPAQAGTEGKRGHLPNSLQEASRIRAAGSVIPYGGGTDLMIEAKKDAGYLFLHKVPELKSVTRDGDYTRFGAALTFAETAESPHCPPLLRQAIDDFAAPAIRNLATIGGNIGNGSPKADSALVFIVANAKLRLVKAGSERVIPIREFYLGRKKLALEPDELIAEVWMPNDLPAHYYKKVGAREALAISRLSFAGLLGTEGKVITHCAVAIGAVSDTILCRADIDAMLIGKTIEQAKAAKQEYLAAYDRAIVPIRGRVSESYRKSVCMNLLRDFLETMGV